MGIGSWAIVLLTFRDGHYCFTTWNRAIPPKSTGANSLSRIQGRTQRPHRAWGTRVTTCDDLPHSCTSATRHLRLCELSTSQYTVANASSGTATVSHQRHSVLPSSYAIQGPKREAPPRDRDQPPSQLPVACQQQTSWIPIARNRS